MLNRLKKSSRQALYSLLAIIITTVFAGGMYFSFQRDVLSTPTIALLFLIPVLMSSSIWGLGPSIVAAIWAFLTFNYLFIPPYYTFSVHRSQDLLVLFVFFMIAFMISQLVGRIRLSLANAHKHLAEITQLYEFSASLASLRQVDEVAHHTLTALQLALNADAIRIHVESAFESAPLTVVIPEQSDSYIDWNAGLTLPLITNRGAVGEIQVLRPDVVLSDSELQLLRAFASTGALALERVLLEKQEGRAKALEESDRFKSMLLASLSHDLRTPLVTMKAAATSLRSGEVEWDKPARQELLAALDEETDRLNELVGDLLNMSRIDAGVLKLQCDEYSILSILEEAIAPIKPRIGDRQLVLNIPDNLPVVRVDHKLIARVFINLIENSLKYSPTSTPIEIAAHNHEGKEILIEIINAGPAVPEQHLKSIFNGFQRVTDPDRTPGTGLGLSICKGIIEAHKGAIWAENREGLFAFNFTLPVQARPESATAGLDMVQQHEQ